MSSEDTEEYYGGTYPDKPEQEDFVDKEELESLVEDFERDAYNEMKEVI